MTIDTFLIIIWIISCLYSFKNVPTQARQLVNCSNRKLLFFYLVSLTICLLVAIPEEIIFRYHLIKFLKSYDCSNYQMVSAILFGLAHLPDRIYTNGGLSLHAKYFYLYVHFRIFFSLL